MFTQKRYGKNGKLFSILKFRTLKNNAPRNIATKEFYSMHMYFTKSGKTLRKLSLDELPQLFNILFLKMSFIGPRPLLWNQHKLFELRKNNKTYLLKPGITGLAQISMEANQDDLNKINLDGFYSQKLSLLLDMKILLFTIKLLIKRIINKMRIIITGKNGYLSKKLYYFLTNLNHTVELISVRDDKWKIIDFSGYECFIHCAGYVHKKETKKNRVKFFEINTNLTIEIAKKAKNDGLKHFIFISSMAIFGGLRGAISKETNPKPRNAYGLSKLKAEIGLSELLTNHFKVSVLRPPVIYSNDSPGNIRFLLKVLQFFPFFPTIKNKKSFISIDNLLYYINEVINLRNNFINISDGLPISSFDFVKKYKPNVIGISFFNPMFQLFSFLPLFRIFDSQYYK